MVIKENLTCLHNWFTDKWKELNFQILQLLSLLMNFTRMVLLSLQNCAQLILLRIYLLIIYIQNQKLHLQQTIYRFVQEIQFHLPINLQMHQLHGSGVFLVEILLPPQLKIRRYSMLSLEPIPLHLLQRIMPELIRC